MEIIFKEFLENPTGRRYDTLIHQLNVTATKSILSKKLDKTQQVELVSAGMDAIGQSDLFYQWLWTTIYSEDAKPIDLIRDGQFKKVMHILGRIQYGVYS